MADTVTIGNIDTSTSSSGYVTVPVSITISSTAYTPDSFVVQATDVPSVVASVKAQAEIYKANVLNAIAANGTAATVGSLGALDGQIINL